MRSLRDSANGQADSGPRPPSRRVPGLAVLPFECAAEDHYFGDGITEEIVAALSSNRALFVIARQSALRYRNRQTELPQIATELNVRYLVQGSVRRHGQRLRIAAELVDAPQSQVIWSESFDGSGDDLFDIQSRIATRIAATIDPLVQGTEIATAVERRTSSMSAYDCVLRGLSLQHRFDESSFSESGRLFAQAVALDPSYAQAHAHLAWWHNLRYGESRSTQASIRATRGCCRRPHTCTRSWRASSIRL
jgi:adenylate cyclase